MFNGSFKLDEVCGVVGSVVPNILGVVSDVQCRTHEELLVELNLILNLKIV